MELNLKQQERFLQLVASVASPIYFERELGLTPREVDFYKEKFSVENPDDARRALRKLATESEEQLQARIRDNIQKQRAAEAVAQRRLEEFETKKRNEAEARKAAKRASVDGNAVRQEDADRQRAFQQAQEAREASRASMSDWRLELDGRQSFDAEIIAAFQYDLEHHGVNFCIQKYNASVRELRAEAVRLGLNINWDLLRR